MNAPGRSCTLIVQPSAGAKTVGLRQLPLGILKLSSDLRDRRVFIFKLSGHAPHEPGAAGACLKFTRARLSGCTARRVKLRLEFLHIGLCLLKRKPITRAG